MQNQKSCYSTVSSEVDVLTQRNGEGIGQGEFDLKRLLKGLNLLSYHSRFLKEDVTYSDMDGISEEELVDVIPKKVHRRRLLKHLSSNRKESSKESTEPEGIHVHVKWKKETKKVYDIPLETTNEELISMFLSEFLECEVMLQDEERMLAKSLKSFNLQKYAEEKKVSPGSMLRAVLCVKGSGVEDIGYGGTLTVEQLRKELENSQLLRKELEKTMLQKTRDLDAVVKEKKERERGLFQQAHDLYYGLNGAKIDERKAFYILEQLENEGVRLDGNGLYTVGDMYSRGFGVIKDQEKASEYFKRAAQYYSHRDEDDLKPIDLNNLGMMYVDGRGRGFECDRTSIIKGAWLVKRAADKGNPVAMLNFARRGTFFCIMSLSEIGNIPNVLTLIYEAAYNKDNTVRMASAIFYLASLYCRGNLPSGHGGYVKKDRVRGYRMFHQGSELGCKDSMWGLGIALYYGKGVEVNKDRAQVVFRKAAELGCTQKFPRGYRK